MMYAVATSELTCVFIKCITMTFVKVKPVKLRQTQIQNAILVGNITFVMNTIKNTTPVAVQIVVNNATPVAKQIVINNAT